MKTLLSSIVMASAVCAVSVKAAETADVEAVAAALIKQQNASVSQAVDLQLNQDIQFALRAMQMPKVQVNKTMIAKADVKQSKDKDSE